jgi:hypothetical protein
MVRSGKEVNKMHRRTSKITMRLLFAAIALTVYGLTAGTAFACPFLMAATHEEPCSDCPTEERCPPEACVLVCPYTVETTAIVTTDEHHAAFVPVVAPALQLPPLTRVHVPQAHTREFDSGDLYLRNRVLLI